MTRDDLHARLSTLKMWKRGMERSPSKPLLLLLALGEFAAGRETVPFTAAEAPLRALLREFGPPRRVQHPEYPFWRLRRDGLWSVRTATALPTVGADGSPTARSLRDAGAIGAFPESVARALRADPLLGVELAIRLLNDHFPATLHEDILEAVGLTIAQGQRKPRDPRFRQRVLTAYAFRCAVCGLQARLGDLTIGLEAAHIRWHQHGGPDVEANGLALCSTHHKLFDLGAFTIQDAHAIAVSGLANGNDAFASLLLDRHGQPLRVPRDAAHHPDPKHLAWHRAEVFRAPAFGAPSHGP
jgi:putative restriction endonuclease